MPAHGEVIAGRYELDRVIGTGGMADVYRGRDLILERDVAVKILRLTTGEEVERARFAVEARTVAALNHPGLVTILDAGIDSERPYLVMELIEGPTLDRHVRENGPLDRPLARELGAQLAGALAYAHASGVVHRDVKPSNILLRANGHAVLTDFGIARLLADTSHHTLAGQVIGSPPYLAPEQVNGGHATTAVDVYALGLVLLEVITGQRAYDGPPIEAAIARLTTPPTFPASLDRQFRRLLERMTALDPDDRPSADEVAGALAGGPAVTLAPLPSLDVATGPFDLSDRTVVDATLPDARQPSSRRRTGRLLMAAAAVVAAATIGLVGLFQLTPDDVAATPTTTPTPSSTSTPTSTPSPTTSPLRAVAASSAPTRARAAAHGTKHSKPAAHHKHHSKGKGKGKGHSKK